MKSILLSILVFLGAVPAFAGSAWAQTPFWQTSYPESQILEIQSVPPELVDDCKHFESLAWNSRDVVQIWKSSQMESFRSSPLPNDMAEIFKLELPLRSLPGSDLGPATLEMAKNDVLPNFTQDPGQVLWTLDGGSPLLQIKHAAKSLTSISESFSLETPKPRIAARANSFFLVLDSKDLACDLIFKRAQLVGKVKVQVKISLDSQMKIQSFYSEIERLSNQALMKSRSPAIRAALLGFSVGEYLTQQNHPVEPQITELLTRFFNLESMDPNSNWIDSFGKKALSVSGTSSKLDQNIQIQGN